MRSLFKRYKNKMIDKTSDLLSFPARYSAGKKAAKAAMEVDILKKARQIPNHALGTDYRDENFRIKTTAENIKSAYKSKRYSK